MLELISLTPSFLVFVLYLIRVGSIDYVFNTLVLRSIKDKESLYWLTRTNFPDKFMELENIHIWSVDSWENKLRNDYKKSTNSDIP
jgi:hypothetical protein